MPRQKIVHYWACDFETTVWGEELEKIKGKKQDKTEVWSGASVELYDDKEQVFIDNSLRDFLNRFLKRKENDVCYFHNLSFDGSFIIDFLLRNSYTFYKGVDKEQPNKTFQASISKMGAWYYIKIKHGHKLLEIRNSLKLLPSSLDNIAKSFKTKHQKLEMCYEGDRHAYCDITEEEKKYIRNDVLVLKEALEKMFDSGHDKLTIGACCLSEFKSKYDKKTYEEMFPDLRDCILETKHKNAWEYVHKSYHGGWCFVNPKYAGTLIYEGVVYDVNSLYPSVMHSESGNKYPVGKAHYKKGAPSAEMINNNDKYYFIRFKCRFKLKDNSLPWLHIRGTGLYKGNENLYTSDVKYKGKYYRYYRDSEGNLIDTKIELTMTCKDYELFQETYDIFDLEIIDHVWFWAQLGIYDEYLNFYKELKIKSEGFERELAKLFLNNLYGKMAMSDDSSYKEPYLDEETNTVRFILHDEHEKNVGYIACGSAITSYAMNFTVRAALANIDRFCYADTDSIHLTGYEDAEGITEDPVNFCCWKQEGKFDQAYYLRQKVYAERMIEKNHKPCEGKIDLKCAGMGKDAKREFLDNYTIDQLEIGLELEKCNLKATRVYGGILLRKKDFKLRKSVDKKVCV